MSYKRTFLDRHGPDGALRFRVVGPALMIFGLVTVIAMLFGASFLMSAAGGLAAAGFGVALAWGFGQGVGSAFGSFIWPSGRSTPYSRQFSFEDSLVARGRIDEAVRSFEEIAAAEPSAVDVRLKLADLLALESRDPARAAQLFREVRALPNAGAAVERYASNRLVDLLLGPLRDEGRALVELRRIIDRHPGSREAQGAREAIDRLKRARGT